MKQVIIINGYASSGKDTFIDMCQEHTRATRLWTSTPAKKALMELGWDGVNKGADIRYVLQQLIEMSEFMFDGTVAYLDVSLAQISDGLVFIHCREHGKINRLKTRYSAKTLFISSDSAKQMAKTTLSNTSDTGCLENYDYDTVIDNNYGFAELRQKAKEYCEEMTK